jgi:hypothetical protein
VNFVFLIKTKFTINVKEVRKTVSMT